MEVGNSFVRGGQLTIHKYQMLKQVFRTSFFICMFVSVLAAAFLFLKTTSSYERALYWEHLTAEWQVNFYSRTPHAAKQNFVMENGSRRKVRSLDVLNDSHIRGVVQSLESALKASIFRGSFYGFISFFLLIAGFYYHGYRKSQNKVKRGNSIVPLASLKKMILKARDASDLKVETLPLIKDAETKHILVAGTTGSGKTNLFNDLLPQIIQRGDRAIVVDTTGDMVAKYYSALRGDVLINPFDVRGVHWDMFSECQHEYQFDNLAKSIVPENTEFADPIWKNGSAKLLSIAFQKANAKGMSLKELYELLVQSSLSEFGRFFERTDAYTFADPKGDRTTMSFRSTLADSIQFMKHIERGDFSFAQWIADKKCKSWVFITANEDMLSTLNPLIAGMFTTASTVVMSQEESKTRRIWFVLDELPVLQKLKSFSSLLAKGRKYGACVLAGLQSFSQFEKNFGMKESQTILNLFNTKFFFRFSENNACAQVSKWLGEQEIEEVRESLSYGANSIRDGASLNNQRVFHKLVLPTEIAQLPNLSCFVKYPGDYPVARLDMSYKNVSSINQPFKLSTEKAA